MRVLMSRGEGTSQNCVNAKFNFPEIVIRRSSQNSNSMSFVNRSVRSRNTDPSRKNAD